MILVFCGKGGVGKSTAVVAVARVLQARAYRGFAVVDTDPVGETATLLGVPTPTSITEALEAGKLAPSGGAGGLRFDTHVKPLLVAMPQGGVLARMGHPRTEGCFCRVNGLTKVILRSIMDQYGIVLMDSEAGLEHITRGTGGHDGHLVLIADESYAALKVARDTLVTARALPRRVSSATTAVHLLVRQSSRRILQKEDVMDVAEDLGLPQPRFLPYDAQIARAQAFGEPLPTYTGVDKVLYDSVANWLSIARLLPDVVTTAG